MPGTGRLCPATEAPIVSMRNFRNHVWRNWQALLSMLGAAAGTEIVLRLLVDLKQIERGSAVYWLMHGSALFVAAIETFVLCSIVAMKAYETVVGELSRMRFSILYTRNMLICALTATQTERFSHILFKDSVADAQKTQEARLEAARAAIEKLHATEMEALRAAVQAAAMEALRDWVKDDCGAKHKTKLDDALMTPAEGRLGKAARQRRRIKLGRPYWRYIAIVIFGLAVAGLTTGMATAFLEVPVFFTRLLDGEAVFEVAKGMLGPFIATLYLMRRSRLQMKKQRLGDAVSCAA